MVGALAGTHLIPLERKAFEEIIRESFPGAHLADNLQAFAQGLDSIQEEG
jgi:Pyruvate/2-oxoacid:ferredoxin oxidoreductase gamma subunit